MRQRHFVIPPLCLATILAAFLPGRPQAAAPAAAASPQKMVRYAPDRDYDLIKITLDLKTDYDTLTLSGTAVNRLAPLRDGLTDIVLDCGQNLNVAACAIDGVTAPFRRDGDKLKVHAPGSLERGRPLSVEVRYSVKGDTAGLHWIKTTAADPMRRGFWTIGQPEHNRTWVPTWDYPNDFAVFETRVSVPADWTVVGNGALQSDSLDAGGRTRTFDWLMDQPCATYLLSLTAGPLDVLRDEWPGVPLLYTAPKGKGGLLRETFSRTPELLTFYSDLFGVKYPWPKYAESVMYDGSGGMENVSATLFGDDLLADKRRGPRATFPVIAHELVHQWLGDLVTYRNWGEVWIGEGFAVLFGQLAYIDHWQGRNEFDHQLESVAQGYFSESRQYKRALSTRFYAAPEDMYDNHSYLKGALVLHTLRRRLGEDAFLRGVHGFIAGHRNEPVDSGDLCRSMTEATGINVAPFFDQWVFKPGHPVLDYSWSWDAAKNEVALAVKQVQDVADGTPVYTIAAAAGLISDGKVRRERIRLDRADQELRISCPGKPDAVLLDPDHDFLREIKPGPRGVEELLQIMRYAPNAVDRDEAMKSLLEGQPSGEIVRSLVAALRADGSEFPVFRSTQGLAALARADLRPFFREEMRHPFIARRVEAVRALARLPRDPADVQALRKAVGIDEPYDVVRAALRTLAAWDAAGNRDIFRAAAQTAPGDKVIRFIALDALAKADADQGRPVRDPSSKLTGQIAVALAEIARGATALPWLTDGMRSLAGRPDVQRSIANWLKDEKSFSFLARDEEHGRGPERRGSKIERTLTYKMETGGRVIYLAVYLTADGKLADLDAYR